MPVPRAAVAASLLVVFLGLRLVHLEADPPERYPTGELARELVVEGPAKAHEARRFGLFGTFETKAADGYRVWRVQSPAYVLPLAGWFRLVGVGRAELRVFGAIAAGLGFLAFLGLAGRHRDRLVLPLAGLVVALSFHDVQLVRGGLIEPVLNGVLAAAFLAAVLALERLPWLLVAELAFAAALLTKQTALVASPALLGLGVAALVRARRRGVPAWQPAAALGLAVALAGGLLAYVLSPAYWRTVEWNFGHMITGVGAYREPTLDAVRLEAVLARLADPVRWREGVFAVVPLAALSLLGVGRLAARLVRRRPVDAVDLAAAGWFVAALLALQLTGHVRPRFSIVLLPPAALLAGGFLVAAIRRLGVAGDGWRVHGARLAAAGVALAAAGAVILTDVRWTSAWLAAPRYEFRDAARVLERELTARDVVVGTWAPAIAFDSPADLFYVKPSFNDRREALAGLGITHVLARRRDHAGRRVAKAFPGAWEERELRAKVQVLGRDYSLFRFPSPLR